MITLVANLLVKRFQVTLIKINDCFEPKQYQNNFSSLEGSTINCYVQSETE